MTPAALYRRVSTDHQAGSLEVQEKRVLDYCQFKGLDTSADLTFSDPDTSGRTPIRDREGGSALLARLSFGDVKHLVIAKLDRLGRNVIDAVGVLEELQARGIVLHITDLGGESITTQGHMGKLILTMLLAVAEWEVAEIRDRTRKRLALRFDRLQLTGNVPYGYDCRYSFADGFEHLSSVALFWGSDTRQPDPEAGRLTAAHGKVTAKDLVDNPAEQTVIRQMHAWRNAGCKLEDIAAQLNAQGLRPKISARWQAGNVQSVLTSRHTQRLLNPAAPEPAAIPQAA